MKRKPSWFLSCLFVLGMASLVRADDPTSRFFPLSPLASSLAPSSTGTVVQFEVWDDATAGNMIFAEAHTVDTDAGSRITNDTGRPDLLLGRGTAGGLAPANFPAGSTRYLDVTQGGATLLTARLPLYASVFGISPPSDVPGNLTLADSSDTAGNILKGGVLFLHNFGTNNAFLGSNAGNLSMTGTDNTGSGANALQNNTTGRFNTATGANALVSNTIGANNTASGFQALTRNTTGNANTANGSLALSRNCSFFSSCSGLQGSYNTASGFMALSENLTGYYNTASGSLALQFNFTGVDNTADGVGALQFNTIGANNTANGVEALHFNANGNYNTASGVSALSNNCSSFSSCSGLQGSYNTASGFIALSGNRTGYYNTAIGSSALAFNTTGNSNTAIGTSADVSDGNLTNATALGYNAIVNASNKIRLGNAAVTLVETQGDFHSAGAGNGIIVKSPNGTVCRRLSIDDTGALVLAAVTCP